jgi:hypothetical protein
MYSMQVCAQNVYRKERRKNVENKPRKMRPKQERERE